MKGWGGSLIAIGAIVVIVSWLLPVSVSTDTPDLEALRLGISLSHTADVLNIGLLQRQMIVFQSGLALAMMGAIFVGAGTIAEHLAGSSVEQEPQSAPPEAAAPATPVPAEQTPEEIAEEAAEADRLLLKMGGAMVAIILVILVLAWALTAQSGRNGAGSADREVANLSAEADALTNDAQALIDNSR